MLFFRTISQIDFPFDMGLSCGLRNLMQILENVLCFVISVLLVPSRVQRATIESIEDNFASRRLVES